MITIRIGVLSFCCLFVLASSGIGEEPFRYPEAKHGQGELQYQNGIPIVTLEGSPAEIGEQMGVLVLKPASELLAKADNLLEAHGLEKLFPFLKNVGNVMIPQFPPDHLVELESAAKHSGWPRELLVLANTIPDLRKLTSCSALLVAPERSETGGPLFGRNLDTTPFLPLHEYTFVAVYRPTGKRAFAIVAYPGTIGCYSGMNDAGLALADLTVSHAADGSKNLDPTGVPYTLAMRRVLEECGTAAETENLIRSLKRTTMQNLAVCDAKEGVVLEITTKSVIPRQGEQGVCACTNHFRTRELIGADEPPSGGRFERLEQARQFERLSVEEVIKKLDEVSGPSTLQAMVFEPAVLKLHLSVGAGQASALPFTLIDLKWYFETDRKKE